MGMTEDLYWYWLTNISGVGRGSVARLIAHFGTPASVYDAPEETVFAFFRSKIQKENFKNSKDEEQIVKGMERLSDMQIRFLHQDSRMYPKKLRYIPDPPYSLYLQGRLPEPEKKAVAIIGARNCTRYGREMARVFGRELAKYGVTVISGLARGIDGMAHVGALETGGYTLGVVGGGIDQIYPKENYRLFMQMREKGGILSESNIGIRPAAGLFPLRNRLIAGLCDGILVVEAMEKSGTFITVDQGLEQGREIFALPGRVTDEKSAGCNRLLKLGAHVVTEADDILQILGISYPDEKGAENFFATQKENQKMSLAPMEKMVYSCLEIEPKYIDCIIYEVKLAPQDICKTLNVLVMRGVIAETDKNYYAIKV